MLLAHIHPVALFSSDCSAAPNANPSGLEGIDTAVSSSCYRPSLVTVTTILQQAQSDVQSANMLINFITYGDICIPQGEPAVAICPVNKGD